MKEGGCLLTVRYGKIMARDGMEGRNIVWQLSIKVRKDV